MLSTEEGVRSKNRACWKKSVQLRFFYPPFCIPEDLRYNRPCARISVYPKSQLQGTKRRNPVRNGRYHYIIRVKDY